MSRRTVLTALFARATLAARPGLVRPAGDDAELIRLGAQFQKHQTTLSAWDHDVSISDEQITTASDEWWELLNRATELPARTFEGLRAKAAMFEPLIIQTVGPGTNDPRHRFALSLARDVLAQEVGAKRAALGQAQLWGGWLRMIGMVERGEWRQPRALGASGQPDCGLGIASGKFQPPAAFL